MDESEKLPVGLSLSPIAISPTLTLQLFVLILNLRRKVLPDFSMIPTKATDSLLEEIQHVGAE